MKRQPRILAGTAIGLLMASAPLGAYPLQGATLHQAQNASGLRPILAQSECLEGETAEDCAARVQQPAEESAPAEEAAPAEQAPAAAEQSAEPAAEQPAEQAPEAAEPAQEAAPAQSEQAPAEAAPAEAMQPEAPAAEQPAEQAAPERKKKRDRKPADGDEQAVEEAAPAPVEQAPTEAAPAETAQPEAPAAEQPAATVEPSATEAPAAEQPVQAGEAPASEDEAPLLDSQKEQPRKGGRKNQQAAEPAPEPVDQGPPPASDAAAAEAAQPAKIEPATSERGKRVDRDERQRRRERPEGTDVLREIGNRLIIELGDQIIVESDDRPRMTRGARDVYYEELPRGRTRETIVRANGVQIVTIRNRYGDVIRRSRITPDGREYVLVYVDEDNYDRLRDWRDPGDDLPPMRLNIPRRQYILESEYVDDPDDYYEFLEQPPVEKVQRLYSIDEVKRSARVRDIARRVDLDTLTFEFGSATIPESEIAKLEGVATAMERLLEKNPAETFLIEGHTDAVGSDTANLALSDRRAEAVAEALTNVFDIPPENLAPQGYGERYLKVKTEGPERQNRRVAIRRITPLVAPVASAN